ncbi:VWA domain-containing protein [Desulfothermus naphthae]
MFVDFFYLLRENGIPVSPTAFLRLQKALYLGIINSLFDFYTAARSILIKSERYFDLYDRLFAHYFEGKEFVKTEGVELSDTIKMLLREWLKEPKLLADALGIPEDQLKKMTPKELEQYFLDRLREQTEEHHGGNRWIGTGGTSPVGHSGFHPGGMRVGGVSRNKSAIKVALERRYKDYNREGPLTTSQIGEALRQLKNLQPVGPKDQLNIPETIRETVKNAGEIELVFERSLKDKLKVVLAIDNGGWSMDPYVEMVQVLFDYAKNQFKDLKVFYFHNTIYDYLWEDPPRIERPYKVTDLVKLDPDTRFIIVGDASMAPYELLVPDGSIYFGERSGIPSIEILKFIRKTFKYSVWLNPKMEYQWKYTQTILHIKEIFPMFELSLRGLEKMVKYLSS